MPDENPLLRVRARDGSVTLMFAKPVTWVPMSAEQTRKLGTMLLKKADEIDPPAKKKRTRPQPVNPPSLPSWLSQEVWDRWVAHRIEIKEPMTFSMMAANIRTMERLWKAGQNIEAVIDQSIAGGYQGLFPLKDVPAANVAQQPTNYTAPVPDNKRCVRCAGTGHWYPNGFGGGVAPCREHQWADDEPQPAPAETVVAIESYLRKVAMK